MGRFRQNLAFILVRIFQSISNKHNSAIFVITSVVTLVEWLTRCPAIKLGNAFGRTGSNPVGDG